MFCWLYWCLAVFTMISFIILNVYLTMKLWKHLYPNKPSIGGLQYTWTTKFDECFGSKSSLFATTWFSIRSALLSINTDITKDLSQGVYSESVTVPICMVSEFLTWFLSWHQLHMSLLIRWLLWQPIFHSYLCQLLQYSCDPEDLLMCAAINDKLLLAAADACHEPH